MPSGLPWPLPPALILLAGAAVVALLRGTPRKLAQVAFPALALYAVWAARQGAPDLVFPWMGYEAHLFHVDALRLVFGGVFATVALLAAIYALHLEDPVHGAAALVYAAGSLGVCFAGDLLAFVLFWELMGISSALLVFRRWTPRSRAAGTRYVAFHALGGALLVAGIVTRVAGGHGLALTPFTGDASGWLVLLGVAVNAAIPPLHAWLPDAYPEATPEGAVYLSVFTTKTAVFALILLFPGWQVLIAAGTVMAIWGVVYALMANDVRRLLAYSIVSQVGYMVAAVGVGTPLALDGAAAHAFAHILYKSLLFMAAGALLYATGRARLTRLGGLARAMPFTLGIFAVGAAAISGVPGFNGFTTKTMEIAAAGAAGHGWVALALEVAAAGTFLYTGCKLLWFVFFAPPPRIPPTVRPLPWNMKVAMLAGAVLCVLFGVDPGLLYGMLPFPAVAARFHPYALARLGETVALLGGVAVAFVFVRPWLAGREGTRLDLDWLYRRPGKALFLGISRGLVRFQDAFGRGLAVVVAEGLHFLHNPLVLAERVLGRGVFEPRHAPGPGEGFGRSPYSEHRYRPPVGVTILVVLTVFAVVGLLTLLGRMR